MSAINKKIQFFDYRKLWIEDRKNYISILDSISSTGGFIMQKSLRDFEKRLAKFTNSNFAVGVGNATDGMEIFLEAIGLKKGDEIIISSHTMLATASAIKFAGGTPVPVDIGKDNLISVEAIENSITSNTVGIMPTQLNGRICNMKAIKKIANKKGLFIVEDAAQALGASYCGQHAGTFGLASCISFFPAKVLGCFGDAGGVLVKDKYLYNKIYQLHDHGRDVDGKVKRWGRNSRLDNLQAGILNYKLNNFNKIIKRRREIAQFYHNKLKDLGELQLPPPPSNHTDNFDVYQNYEITADRRDSLKKYLEKKKIGTLIQWGGKGIHHFRQLGFKQSLPNTDKFFKRCLMLPMNIFLNNKELNYICKTIRSFYKK